MTYPFNARKGLVIVSCEIAGRTGNILLRLALDTGATGTLVSAGPLAAVGYDPSLSPDRLQVTTGSGVEYAPRVVVDRIRALGHEYRSFPLIAHTIPASARVDGLLGLDFLRGLRLNLDFQMGTISLHE